MGDGGWEDSRERQTRKRALADGDEVGDGDTAYCYRRSELGNGKGIDGAPSGLMLLSFFGFEVHITKLR